MIIDAHVHLFPTREVGEMVVKQFQQTYGADRVLFGSDHPWIDPKGDIERIRRLALTAEEKHQVLGQNAARILGIVGR